MSGSCGSPLRFELVDYFAGRIESDRQDQLEEHLFSCTECTERSSRFVPLIRRLRRLDPPVISHARLEQLVQQGMRIRITDVEPDSSVDVVFSNDVDLLVHRLRGDLAGVSHVDCEITGGDGSPVFMLERVPFDAEKGEVLIACQRHYLGVYPSDIVFRVTAVDAAGVSRVRRYTVVHAA